jgi:hypothetical protein
MRATLIYASNTDRHFGGDRQCFRQKVRRAHSRFHCAERVLHRLAATAHCLRILVEAALCSRVSSIGRYEMGPSSPGLPFSVFEEAQRESGVSGFTEAAERALSLAFDLVFAPSFCKRAVRRHEPCQDRRDQFQRVSDRLPGFACKRLSVILTLRTCLRHVMRISHQGCR